MPVLHLGKQVQKGGGRLGSPAALGFGFQD